MALKQRVYDFVAKAGVKALLLFFPEYFAKDPLAPSDRYIEYPFAIRNLPAAPAKILDVGSASTFFPLLLASFGYQTHAVDIRKYSILNRLSYENFTFHQGNIIKTSFPDNHFDAITAISTIEHIGFSGRYGNIEDLSADKKALAEMKRILRPGGLLILTIPFGMAKVLRPFSKIYDAAIIKELIEGLLVEKEEYYLQDSRDDWYACSKEEAGLIEPTIYKSALCLLRLRKSNAGDTYKGVK